MKNKRLEDWLRSAKKYAKGALSRSQYDPVLGIVIFHTYLDENGNRHKDKGYWDDCSFKLGSYYISVNWTHPRYWYEDECDSTAYEITNISCNRPSLEDQFKTTKTNYKKVGKSRKKIVSYEMGNLGCADNFYDIWKEERELQHNTSDYVAKCHFNVKITGWSRSVDICYPIEVIDEESLVVMTNYVKECLKDPSLFNSQWKNYEYTKDTWKLENANLS